MLCIVRTQFIYGVLWKWSRESPIQRNSGHTHWLKIRNIKHRTSTPNFKLQAEVCARQCVQLCERAQGKPRAVHRSRRKMKSYWNSSRRGFPEEDGSSPAQARPSTEGGMRVWWWGGEGARRVAEEESSMFSLFSIFNEVGPHCINASVLRRRQEKI